MLPILLCLLSGLATLQDPPDPFDPDRQSWMVALTVARLESIPKAAGLGETEWFGGPLSGYGGLFLSSGDEHTVQIQVRAEEEFELNDLRFRLVAEGATVQVTHYSDTFFGPLQDVGGVACLVTAGQDTALEFEIYCVFGGGFIHPCAGAVWLHGYGRELALDLAKRKVFPDRSPLDRLVRITGLEDESQSHGYVDQLGRRQGPWSLKQKDGQHMQVGWFDGVPHGTVLDWDEAGRLRSLTRYQLGLEEGETMDWNEEGGIKSIWPFSRGQPLGRRLVFHPSGIKQFDEFVNLAPDRSSYLARFDALHTRPKP